MKLHEFKQKTVLEIKDVKEELYYDAIALGTFKKAIKFVKDQKDETNSFSATAEEALIYNVSNQICDEVLKRLREEAYDQPTPVARREQNDA